MNLERILHRLGTALFAAALLFALGGAALWTAQRPRFDLRRIEVTGDLHHTSRAALRAAIAGRLSGTFFTLHLASARAAFETVPWVAAASVRRVWPDRLVVSIKERRAVGLWSDGRVVSDAGVLFDVNPAEAELDGPLIEFTGPAALAPEAVRKLGQFRPLLETLHAQPAALEVSDRLSWTVRTTAGMTLDLGRDEPAGSVQARLAAIVASYPTVLAQLSGPPSRIDARYNNGFAATRP